MRQEDWKPIDVDSLEPNAEKVVRSNCNMLVTAGPGAGKTELLAQRACYLLQTDTCKSPQKILAISFKRDAADNLKQRVKLRCGEDFADRFVSVTYDSFFKDILDRFKSALPNEYSVTDYDITDIDNRNSGNIIDNCGLLDVTFAELQTIPHDKVEDILLCGKKISELNADYLEDKVAIQIWHNYLKEKKLTFKMVSRLCELILECNPIIIRCLQFTYSHVFLDEFQDTTKIQYGILTRCFKNSSCILTAVGDDKQQIMVWVGALLDAFDKFKYDFSANQISLQLNYRSVPELVEIQKNVAQLITRSQEVVTSKSEAASESACDMFIYSDENIEAQQIAYIIFERIRNYNLKINEVCILVRQRTDLYGALIISELKKLGIKSRIEDNYQKLLAEPLVQLVINYLKLWDEINSESWRVVSDFYEASYDEIDDNFIFERLDKLNSIIFEGASLEQIIDFIIFLLGVKELKQMYPQYKNISIWNKTINDLKNGLSNNARLGDSYKTILENFEGKNSIPIMSIHKSKGLEYDTVIFLGLEDSAFGNFPNKPKEESCVFFVALSRAKRKIIFTITKHRKDKKGYNKQNSLSGIKPVIDKLQESQVCIYKYDNENNNYKKLQ